MPRWEPNGRMRLVESALELFEEQGYDKTGVAQIAERAGLTKTTFFRHFPDKREVLFAGQEAHNEVLAAAVAAAPADATPLELVTAALDALAAEVPPDRHGFAVRLRAAIDDHSDLREREALKFAGYQEAIVEALRRRSVPDASAAVAADLGILAFRTAFHAWAQSRRPPALPDLVRATLDELHTAGLSLR